MAKEVLCIGPVGSGKTTLLRKLTDPSSLLTVTIPTTGNNLLTLKLDKKLTVNVNELGGTMSPIWSMYYTNCAAIIFVVDASNLQQVSCSCVLLLEILNHTLLKEVPVLLVLNKKDLKTTTTVAEIKSLLFLDSIQRFATQRFDVIETSSFTGEGLTCIENWLLELSDI